MTYLGSSLGCLKRRQVRGLQATSALVHHLLPLRSKPSPLFSLIRAEMRNDLTIVSLVGSRLE